MYLNLFYQLECLWIKLLAFFVKMGYDCEVLKIDALYPLTFDNIIALKDGNDIEKCIFERFNDMFFKIK